MVASVLRDRPNVVERKVVQELVEHILLGHSPIKRNWMPDFLLDIMKWLIRHCRVLHVHAPGEKERDFLTVLL
jgi:hypothetical protein